MKRWLLYGAFGFFLGIIPKGGIASDSGSERSFYKAVSKHQKVVALFYGEAGEKGEQGDEMEALTSRFVQVSKRRIYKKEGIIFVLVQAEKGKLDNLLSEVGLSKDKLPAIVLFKEGDPIVTRSGSLQMLSGTDIERDDIIQFVNRHFEVKKVKVTESDEEDDDEGEVEASNTETTVTYYTYVYPYPAGFYVGLGPWGGYGWWGFYPWFGYGYGWGWGGGWYGGRHWSDRHGRRSSRSSRSSRAASRKSGARKATSGRRTSSARRTSSSTRRSSSRSGRSTVRRSSGFRRGGHGGRGGGRRR